MIGVIPVPYPRTEYESVGPPMFMEFEVVEAEGTFKRKLVRYKELVNLADCTNIYEAHPDDFPGCCVLVMRGNTADLVVEGTLEEIKRRIAGK